MLRGRFSDGTGRPYLAGELFVPRFDIGGDLWFLIDTGADKSLVGPDDALRIGVDIGERSVAAGLGGAVESYREPAWILFTGGDGTLYGYEVEIDFVPAQPHTLDLPSILGREVIDRWRMVYDPTMDVLEFEVRSADLTIGPED